MPSAGAVAEPSVCLVGDLPPPPGGVATYCRALAEELAHRAWAVHLVDTSGGRGKSLPAGLRRYDAITPLGSLLWSIPGGIPAGLHPAAFRDRVRFRALRGRLRALLRQTPSQLVHANHAGIRSWAALCASRSAGVPFVLTIHGAEFSAEALAPLRPAAVALCRAADAIIANSAFTAGAARACGVDAPIEIIPLGVDTRRFHPGPVPEPFLQRYRIDPARRRILFGGWISRNKGPDVLLAALRLLPPAERDGVECLFVGPDRGWGAELRSQIASSGLDGVRLLEPERPEDFPLFYRTADVFVLPTREYEGFGLAALEALASGCAVVASDLGGIPEAVAGNTAARLVPPGDASALAGELRRLLADREALAALRERAAVEAAERTWARVAAHTEVVYRRLLDAPSRRAR